jgi:bromodomain-containing factor 1
MLKHKGGYWFAQPVDAAQLNLPDYHKIITHPMDLGTLQRNLRAGAYASAKDALADARLVFTNCRRYNGPTSVVVTTGANPVEAILDRGVPQVRDLIRRELNPPPPPPAPAPAPALAHVPTPGTSTPGALHRMASDMSDDRPKRPRVEPPPRDLPALARSPSSSSVRKVKLTPSLKFCEHVLREMMHRKHEHFSWPFLHPVDIVALNIPDYPSVGEAEVLGGTTISP